MQLARTHSSSFACHSLARTQKNVSGNFISDLVRESWILCNWSLKQEMQPSRIAFLSLDAARECQSTNDLASGQKPVCNIYFLPWIRTKTFELHFSTGRRVSRVCT